MLDHVWQNVELGRLLDLEYGRALPAAGRAGSRFPVYGSNGEIGRHHLALVDGPGIVIGRKGTVGAVTWASGPFWPIDTTYFVRTRNGIDPRWLFWRLRGAALERLDSSTGVPGLNRDDVYRRSVELPPVEEQRRIAEILDTVDEAIWRTEEVIAKLEVMKKGLLHDLLTRGIDENGELRDPERQPEQFKDSAVGQIPQQWFVRPLRERLSFVTDYRGSTPPYSDEGIPVISAQNVGGGRVRSITNWVSEDVYRRIAMRGAVEPGDTLFTTEAPVAEVARVPSNGLYHVTRRIIGLRSGPQVEKGFLYWGLLHLARMGVWSKRFHGSTVPRLLKPDILSQAFAVPSLAEQARIVRTLDVAEGQVLAEAEAVAKLRMLKRALMNDLLTGRVRVSTCEEPDP